MEFVDLAAQRRRLGERIDRAIARVVDHGRFIMGPEVYELEERLAEFCGARHAITCSSGTDALLLALLAWGVGPGDAVFVPTFTFAATAEVVALVGAVPVFVDVDAATFNLDPESLEQAVSSVVGRGDLRMAGVIAVDLFGQPANYERITTLASAHGMWVLADAAQSFGGGYREHAVGTCADLTATSFFPAKPLGCYGDGGALFTDDHDLADVVRSLRVHGQGRDKYDNVRVGINGRLDTIQAAVLLAKLTVFGEEIESRRAIADRYTAALSGVVTTPTVLSETRPVWAQYTVLLQNRDLVARRLDFAGVPTAVYYPAPLHRQPAYATLALSPVGLARSEELATSVLSLPVHPYLTADEQESTVEALLQATNGD